MESFMFVPQWRGHVFWTRLRGWIASRRNGSGALSVTVSAPIVTQTRDEAGALHLTIQDPQ